MNEKFIHKPGIEKLLNSIGAACILMSFPLADCLAFSNALCMPSLIK